ncbi:hypothetical protein [Lysobacter sp. Root983]|nr:hypothetical protein [Lysobacter sp. Root983]
MVLGPGNAVTIQQVFQDANQNHYSGESIAVTQMILYERAFWNA